MSDIFRDTLSQATTGSFYEGNQVYAPMRKRIRAISSGSSIDDGRVYVKDEKQCVISISSSDDDGKEDSPVSNWLINS